MTASSNINLLKTKTQAVSPQVATVGSQLKTISTIALILLILAGTAVGGWYIFWQQRLKGLEREKEDLVTRIQEQQQKEGIYISLKDRMGPIEKIVASQVSWDKLFDVLSQLAAPPLLQSFESGDQRSVSLVIKTKSLEEALVVGRKLINLAEAKVVKNPQLMSFVLDREGTIKAVLSFVKEF